MGAAALKGPCRLSQPRRRRGRLSLLSQPTLFSSSAPCHPAARRADTTDKAASLSATLKSASREAGPRVEIREPKHLYLPQSPRSRAAAELEQVRFVGGGLARARLAGPEGRLESAAGVSQLRQPLQAAPLSTEPNNSRCTSQPRPHPPPHCRPT